MRHLSKFLTYPVQWYEGMLLMPQHFQQADQLHHHLLEYHMSTLSPYHWGLVTCHIDQGQLGNGQFRVLSLEGILPDGTVIFFPQYESESLEIDLTPHTATLHQHPLKVYLCLAENMFAENKNAEQARLRRYDSIETHPISDDNTGENALPLARLRPKLQLMVSSVPPARHVAIPLAEIAFQDNTFCQTSFIPPLLRINLEERLGKKCLEIIQRLREKITYLQTKLQNVVLDAKDSLDIRETEHIRRCLVTGLLPLEAVLYAKGMIHPHDLFKAFVQLISQGAALPHMTNVPVLPVYDHEGLQNVFQTLFDLTDRMLSGIEENYIVIPFDQQDRVYSLYLKEAWASPNLTLGISSPSDMSEDALITWAKNCVIATDSFVRTAQDNRILGAERDLIQEASTFNLTAMKGTLLCSVTWDDRFIKANEKLHLFNISDTPETRPQRIALYIPNQPAE